MSSTNERILQYKIRFQEKMNEFTNVMNSSNNNQLKSDNNTRPSNKFSILRNHIINSNNVDPVVEPSVEPVVEPGV